ncbi:MAG: hypothetical protein M0Z60_10785, partial [Nitrospiraceae bacterium]|nr:hypothetical protein [Nitrospiraceae bacterium]
MTVTARIGRRGARGAFGMLSYVLFAAFVLLLAPSLAFSATVGKVEIRGLSSLGEQEFLEMLGIAPGREVDAAMVRDGIMRAFYKGLFDDIMVRVPDGDNPTVEVTVTEREFIRKVKVTGDSALSGGMIRSLFLLKEGDQMRYDLVGRAETALREKLDQYGFPDARINVGIVKADSPYRSDIILKVDTGSPRIIRSIAISLPSSDHGGPRVGA